MASGVVDRLVLEVAGRVDSSARRLPRFLSTVGAAGAAAAAAVAGLTTWAAASADGLIKAAKSANTTTDQYVALTVAADLAGASTQDLLSASGAAANALRGAAQGSKEQALAFQALGIDAAAAFRSGRNFADLLPDIVDGLNRIESPLERQAVGQQVLGSGFARLQSLVQSGSGALRDAAQIVEEYGLSVDDSAAPAIEKFNDSLTLLALRARGAALQLGLQLVPIGQRAIDVFSRLADSVRPRALELYGQAAAFASDQWDRLPTSVQDAIAVIALGVPIIAGATASMRLLGLSGAALLAPLGIIAAIIALGIAVDDLSTFMRGGESASGDMAESLGVDGELYFALFALKSVAVEIKDVFVSMFSAIMAGAERAGEMIGGLGRRLADMGGVEFRANYDKLVDQISGPTFSEMIDMIPTSADDVGAGLKNVGTGAIAIAAGLQVLQGEGGQTSTTFERLIQQAREGQQARRAALINNRQMAVSRDGPSISSTSVSAPITVNGAQSPERVAREIERALERVMQGATLAERG